MKLRSALSYRAISRLQFRIDLPSKGTKKYKSDKEILRRLNGVTPLLDADTSEGKAIFSRLGDDIGDWVFVSADRADQYRHNRALEVRPGEPAILQLGYRGPDMPRHLRMTFDRFAGSVDYRMPKFLADLRKAIGEPRFISAARLTIEDLRTTFLINGLESDDVCVKHHGYDTLEIIFRCDLEGSEAKFNCGYEFGASLNAEDDKDDSESHAICYTDDPYDWEQGRTIALRNTAPQEGELPTIRTDVALVELLRLFELEAHNPLAGLELTHFHGKKKGPVRCWDAVKAWTCVLEELALITLQDI